MSLLTLFGCRRGNFIVSFALFAPVLFGSIGLVADYAIIHQHRKALQEAADGAALAGVKELMVAGSRDGQIEQVAENFAITNSHSHVRSDAEILTVRTDVDRTDNAVKVSLSYNWSPMFAHYLDAEATPIVAEATAKLAGRGVTCVVGLMQPQTIAKASIHLNHEAAIRADGCGVYSNSTHSEGLRIEDKATLIASSICSAGGVVQKSGAPTAISPQPVVDCPKIEDPLRDRQGPVAGGCTHTGFVVREGNVTLKPGTYCYGLTLEGDAMVRLEKGVYILKDGGIVMRGASKLIGKDVSFFLTGDSAQIHIGRDTTVDLEATKDGILAGILFFEDRNNPSNLDFDRYENLMFPKGASVHMISSNNARNLLGTIYLSRSMLVIDANAPVADKSAYTALVVGTLWLNKGPTLYLNSDYSDTEVPVPGGLKSSNSIVLSK